MKNAKNAVESLNRTYNKVARRITLKKLKTKDLKVKI